MKNRPAGSLLRRNWRGTRRSIPIPRRRYLRELDFARADESARHLELLARGPSHAPTSPRRRELLERLGPMLLDEISRLPDPDLALMNLADFIAAVGARTSFLALLEQHPATRRMLLRLFASSAYLSTLFIRHPDMLDTLVRSDLAATRRSPEELRDELAGLVAASPDFESKLDALRTFRHQEFLRIAIADLAGDLELFEVERELTTSGRNGAGRGADARANSDRGALRDSRHDAPVRDCDGPARRGRDVVQLRPRSDFRL